jgi:hypothetical protein
MQEAQIPLALWESSKGFLGTLAPLGTEALTVSREEDMRYIGTTLHLSLAECKVSLVGVS